MKLSNSEIKHIAELSKLELSDEEAKKYGDQLSGVLDYIDQLTEVDTTNVEPTAQVTGLENKYREDELISLDKDEVATSLEQAPEMEDGQVKVKRVLK